MVLELTGKKKKDYQGNCGKSIKKDLEQSGLKKERMRSFKRNGKSESKQKLPTPASWDNGIKMDIVVVVC